MIMRVSALKWRNNGTTLQLFTNTNTQLLFFLSLIGAAVDSGAANDMMDLIRDKYVNGDLEAVEEDESGIKIVGAEEFS